MVSVSFFNTIVLFFLVVHIAVEEKLDLMRQKKEKELKVLVSVFGIKLETE
jgi:hypothetical protein